MRELYTHNPDLPNGHMEYDSTYDTLKINELPPPKHGVWWYLRKTYDVFVFVSVVITACTVGQQIHKNKK